MAPTIECKNEWDEPVEVNLAAGDRVRGIGYSGQDPVCVFAGEIQAAPNPDSKTFWSESGSGRQWTIASRGGKRVWTEMEPGVGPGSGWYQV